MAQMQNTQAVGQTNFGHNVYGQYQQQMTQQPISQYQDGKDQIIIRE